MNGLPDTFTRQSFSQRVRFGSGTLNDLTHEVERLGTARSMLIGGGSASDVVDRARAVLGSRAQSVFDEPQQHVPRSVVDAATELATATNADSLVCIGGGKAIGVAKAVALELRLPIVAVPTTLSGSEATPIYGVSEDGRKNTGRDQIVLPQTVIYDSDLFESLPIHVAGPSGMNALAHAIGALLNPGSDPITVMIGEGACRTIFDVLRRLAKEDARATVTGGDLAISGYLGGYSLTHAGVWFHHKVCHILGGLYELTHAPTHAAMLPHSVSVLKKHDTDAYNKLGRALQSRRPEETLFNILKDVSEPYALRDLGLNADMAATAAQKVSEALPMFDEADAQDMINRAIKGEFLTADEK